MSEQIDRKAEVFGEIHLFHRYMARSVVKKPLQSMYAVQKLESTLQVRAFEIQGRILITDERADTAPLYLVFADRDGAGPGLLRLAEIIRREVNSACLAVRHDAP